MNVRCRSVTQDVAYFSVMMDGKMQCGNADWFDFLDRVSLPIIFSTVEGAPDRRAALRAASMWLARPDYKVRFVLSCIYGLHIPSTTSACPVI